MGESHPAGATKTGVAGILPCILEGVVAPLIIGIVLVFFFFGPTIAALAIIVVLVLAGLLGACVLVARRRPESRIVKVGLIALVVIGGIIVVGAMVVYVALSLIADLLANPVVGLVSLVSTAIIVVTVFLYKNRLKQRTSPKAEQRKAEEPAPRIATAQPPKSATCPTCGAPIRAKERFCRRCGAAVEETH